MTRKLTALARERNTSAIEIITSEINRCQSIVGAAQALEVSPGAIHYHLKRNNLRVETRTVTVVVPARS